MPTETSESRTYSSHPNSVDQQRGSAVSLGPQKTAHHLPPDPRSVAKGLLTREAPRRFHDAGAATALSRQRILVRVDVRVIRFISALMLLCMLACMTVLVVREQLGYYQAAPGRFGWSVALLAAVALIARGVFLGRPVTFGHALAAAAAVCAGLFAHLLAFGVIGNILVGGGGLALMLPTTAKPQPELLGECGNWSTQRAAIRWRLLPCIRVRVIVSTLRRPRRSL